MKIYCIFGGNAGTTSSVIPNFLEYIILRNSPVCSVTIWKVRGEFSYLQLMQYSKPETNTLPSNYRKQINTP